MYRVYAHTLQHHSFVVFLIYGRQPFLQQTKTICLASPRPQRPLGSQRGWVVHWECGPVSGTGQGVAESQSLGQRKGLPGWVKRRQNRLGITTPGGHCSHTGFESQKLTQEEDPRAFPPQRRGAWGVASGWSRGHTQWWGEPGRPQRNGRLPVLQTTVEQKAGGLRVGQGGGAPGSSSQPSAGLGGKFTAPIQSSRASPPLKECRPQWGSGVSVSLGPWNLQLTQGGPHPPQVGHSWVGSDTEHLSSPGKGAGGQGTPPLIAGIPERYLPGLCSQLLQIKFY